ncbi:MAG: metal ABC transporter permease, partial [Deltaproteobacteria bacterium]|nr:metal ABC transporter permease [Deltaproteobacteria bacterium]
MHQLGISDLMLRAFLECLILVGIHAYLGLHVIRRKVIFVDLALAQVAALGTTVGFVFGMAPDSTAALLFSMLFTFVAAILFAVTRNKRDKVPQEAIIGVVFAIAAALVILVVDRAPHGAEHIKEVMTGAILWVKWDAIILAAIVYSAVGLFHYIFRKPILAISNDPEKAKKDGLSLWAWDFWFYMSFGLVISISVRTAGVLLVFVFLVVPAIIASLITGKLVYQLLIGWSMGLVVTILGLGTSYFADMPAGPSVVAFYGIVLGLAAVVIHLVHSKNKSQALVQVAVGTLVTAGLVLSVWLTGHLLSKSSLAQSDTAYEYHGHGPAMTQMTQPLQGKHPVPALAHENVHREQNKTVSASSRTNKKTFNRAVNSDGKRERRCKLLDGSSFADLDPKIPDDLSELSKAF